jgi:pimeloyl-ACP methyl ester carboxylesterase
VAVIPFGFFNVISRAFAVRTPRRAKQSSNLSSSSEESRANRVWGREDAITPVECGEIYQSTIPRSRLTVVEDCGHMPEIEEPAEFAGLVENFLAG